MNLNTIDRSTLSSLEDIVINWEVTLQLTPKQALTIEHREQNTIYNICKQEIADTSEDPNKVCERVIRQLMTKYL